VYHLRIGLLALSALGLTGWFCYALVVGVFGTSDGRIGAGLGTAVTLALAMWTGVRLIRLMRADRRG
jgi:hypothetical protein